MHNESEMVLRVGLSDSLALSNTLALLNTLALALLARPALSTRLGSKSFTGSTASDRVAGFTGLCSALKCTFLLVTFPQ